MDDELRTFAVVRALKVIGDAAKQIPAPLKEQYTEVPWRSMTGMRNKVIHQYFGVDAEVIWNTIKDDLPGMSKAVYSMLQDIESRHTSSRDC